jgi:hypothetical protein
MSRSLLACPPEPHIASKASAVLFNQHSETLTRSCKGGTRTSRSAGGVRVPIGLNGVVIRACMLIQLRLELHRRLVSGVDVHRPLHQPPGPTHPQSAILSTCRWVGERHRVERLGLAGSSFGGWCLRACMRAVRRRAH